MRPQELKAQHLDALKTAIRKADNWRGGAAIVEDVSSGYWFPIPARCLGAWLHAHRIEGKEVRVIEHFYTTSEARAHSSIMPAVLGDVELTDLAQTWLDYLEDLLDTKWMTEGRD